MRYKILSLALLATQCPYPARCQTTVDHICIQVVGSAGLSTVVSGVHYDATLGECAIATLATTDGTTSITQGFHQPECAQEPVSTHQMQLDWNLSLAPNPVHAQFQLHYTHPEGRNLRGRIWSITGNLMGDWQEMPTDNIWESIGWPAGLYLLDLNDPVTGQSTIIRFVKSNL